MTRKKGAKRRSVEAEYQRIRRVVDMVPSMLAYWDADERCRFANRAYETWFDAVPAALIGTTLRDTLGALYPVNLPYIEGVLRGEPQVFERSIPDPKGGPPRIGQAHYLPDLVDGVVVGFAVLVYDISSQKRLEEELRRQRVTADERATHDALTGLPNRLLLEDRLYQTIEYVRRFHRSAAVLFLDLDGFKHVNDTLGHGAGDALLVEVARRLLGVLRKSDTVARLGGDEFVVLLPEGGPREEVATVAQKVLDAIGGAPFRLGDQSIAVTVSVGVSLLSDEGDDAHEALTKADAALYEAKHAGKNRFAFFRDGGAIMSSI